MRDFCVAPVVETLSLSTGTRLVVICRTVSAWVGAVAACATAAALVCVAGSSVGTISDAWSTGACKPVSGNPESAAAGFSDPYGISGRIRTVEAKRR
jgi:hypothetical protein